MRARRKRAPVSVHNELNALVNIRAGAAKLRVLIVTSTMPHAEQEAAWEACCKLAEQLQVELTVLELAARTTAPGLRARLVVERASFDKLYAEACCLAFRRVPPPAQLAEVVYLAEARRARQMPAAQEASAS